MILCRSPPPFFFLDSKKYLSQKNVVEKLNANVMHGKVRRVKSDSSQGVMILIFVARWECLSHWLLSLASLQRIRPIISQASRCVIANYMPLSLFWVARSDRKELFW